MERIWKLVRRFARLRLGLYAANVCYFLVLSLFPGLLVVLVCLRFTPLSATDLIFLVEGLVPSALMGAAETLIVNAYYSSSGTLISLSAVAAVWSASRSIYGLMAGLNRVYGAREDRSFLRRRLISAVYMVLFLGVLVLTLGLHVFGNQIITWLERSGGILGRVLNLRLMALVAVQTLVFALMYKVLPNRANSFSGSLPGALGAALGWQVLSQLFSVYAAGYGDYAAIYGPVWLMAMGMLWLYCCTLILLVGGLVNRLLEKSEKIRK